MAEIIPAIMPKNFEDLKDKMSLVAGVVHLVQIDVVDGEFASPKTWPYSNSGKDPHFAAIIEENEEFPFWKDIEFEADLMVKNVSETVDEWVNAGAARLILHYESDPLGMHAILENINATYSKRRGSDLGIEVGIACGLETPLEALEPFIEHVDFVQFMGIEKIGRQGETLSEKTIGRVADFKSRFPDTIVSVDGGVNPENARLLVNAGADRLVSGSSIFDSEDIRGAIEKLKNA